MRANGAPSRVGNIGETSCFMETLRIRGVNQLAEFAGQQSGKNVLLSRKNASLPSPAKDCKTLIMCLPEAEGV